ncbi:MAG TPA: GGDEF domain-containing protein [Xanthobacteraceae bacterium]|nr:GGDEF domain-containing protein [Xanthobacteraceae bacterium]
MDDTSMNLDINTLFLVAIYVEALLGLLLLFAWAQNVQIRAVAWWGSAHLMRSGSIALFGMYGSVSDLVSIDLANAILFLSFGVTWTGARVFDHRDPLPAYLLVGPLAWLFVTHVPALAVDLNLRVLISCGIITTYTWLTAFEFWRGRGEPLVSRWPAIFMLFAHGSLFLLRTPLGSLLPWLAAGQLVDSVWLVAMTFEALLFTISIAFILLAMAKERAEFRLRAAANVDSLTGIANRRSFLQDGADLTKRHAANPCPVAVLLIDLDHFKSINDQFGHAVGDRVLQIFARTAQENIKPPDLIGRLGGEEFAVVLYDVGHERAAARAELIRTAFAEAADEVDGYPVAATLSIGMVFCRSLSLDLPDLLVQADEALYDAKERGRNRVEVASRDLIQKRRDSLAERMAAVAAARSAA